MNKSVYIVTGANGHLAGTIIRYLERQDCLIRGLLLPSENNTDREKISYYKGDITVPETMEALFSGLENHAVTVIHAAGLISIGNEITPALYNVNVNGTRNVIAMCRKYGVRRLLYVSSVHAISEGDGHSVIREVTSFPKDAVTGAYAITKAEATQAVMDAAKDGLDAVIVHPSGIVGPFDDGRNHIVQLIQRFLDGKLPGGVTGGYDFVDVRDVAKGCIAAAERGRRGECYILSNRFVTIPELMACMGAATGRKVPHCYPLWLVKRMAPLFEWIGKVTHTRPLFTRYSLYTLGSNGRFSHDKATTELGYCPMDIKDSVRDTILYLRGEAADNLLPGA